MTFDYGADLQSEDLYIKHPKIGDFTALLDADILPYVVGHSTDPELYIDTIAKACKMIGLDEYNPKEFPEEGFDALMKLDGFKAPVNHLNWLINNWVKLAEADSALFFLSGENNFRNDVAFTSKYKGNRTKPKPPYFYELRRYISRFHDPIISRWNEADDMMSIYQSKSNEEVMAQITGNGPKAWGPEHAMFSTTCIVTKDKDLRMVPGWFCDVMTGEKQWITPIGDLEPVYKDKEVTAYEQWPIVDGKAVDPTIVQKLNLVVDTYSRGKNSGELKTKRVAVGTTISNQLKKLSGSGLKFFYAQIVMGDVADNYPGIPGKGAKVAYDVLDGLDNEKDMYYAVLDLYKEKYGSTHIATNWRHNKLLELTPVQMMLEQGRLAWMQRFDGDVWRGTKHCPLGTGDEWNEETQE